MHNDIAVITGTGRGLGKALSQAFRDQDWRVIDINRPAFDLTNFDNARFSSLMSSIKGDGRRVFVSNAATLHISAPDALDAAAIDIDFATNVVGPITAIATFLGAFPTGEGCSRNLRLHVGGNSAWV